MTIQEFNSIENETEQDILTAIKDNNIENNRMLIVAAMEHHLQVADLDEVINDEVLDILEKAEADYDKKSPTTARIRPVEVKKEAKNNLDSYEALYQLQKIEKKDEFSKHLAHIKKMPKVVSNLPKTTGLLTPEFIESLIDSREKFITIKAPTSSGKTTASTNISNKYNALFVTPLNAIKTQTTFGFNYNVKTLLEAFESRTPLRGKVSAEALEIALDAFDGPIHNLLVNTTFFIDELHMTTTESTYRPAMGRLLSRLLESPFGQVIGLTATPTDFEMKYSHVIEAESRLELNRTFKSYKIPMKPKGGKVGFRKATIANVVKDIKASIPKDEFILTYSENSLDFNEALISEGAVEVNAPLRDEMTNEIIQAVKAEKTSEEIDKLKESFPFYELLNGNQTIEGNELIFSPMGLAGVNVQNEVATANIIILAKPDHATTDITINQIIGRVRKAKNVNVHIIYDESSEKPRRNKRLSEAFKKDLQLNTKKALSSFAISERTIVNNDSLGLLKHSQLAYLDKTYKQTIHLTKQYVKTTWDCEVEEVEVKLSEEELKATYKSSVDVMVKEAKNSKELYDLILTNDKAVKEEEYDYDVQNDRKDSELVALEEAVEGIEFSKIEGIYTIKKLRNLWREHSDIYVEEGLKVNQALKDGQVRTLRTRMQIPNDQKMVNELNSLPVKPLRTDSANKRYFDNINQIVPSPFNEYIITARGKTKYELLNQFVDGQIKRDKGTGKYFFHPKMAFTYNELLSNYTDVVVEDTDRDDEVLVDNVEYEVLEKDHFRVSAIGQPNIPKAERMFFKNYESSGQDVFEKIGKVMNTNITLNSFEYRDNRRLKDEIISKTNTLFIDYDKQDMTIYEASRLLNDYGIKYHISTGSDVNKKGKFHIILPMDKEISYEDYRPMVQIIAEEIGIDGVDDIAGTNPVFFYNGAEVISGNLEDGDLIDVDFFLEVIQDRQEEEEIVKEEKIKVLESKRVDYANYSDGERPISSMTGIELEKLTSLTDEDANHNTLFSVLSSLLRRGFNNEELINHIKDDLGFDDVWNNKVDTLANQILADI